MESLGRNVRDKHKWHKKPSYKVAELAMWELSSNKTGEPIVLNLSEKNVSKRLADARASYSEDGPDALCVLTGKPTIRLTDAGGAQGSPDRVHSALKGDDPKQRWQWVRYFEQLGKNAMSAKKFRIFLDDLVDNSNYARSDAFIKCYEDVELYSDDEQSNTLLREVGAKRVFDVPKASTIFNNQGVTEGRGKAKRKWISTGMNTMFGKFGSTCSCTGVKGGLRNDLTMNRYVDKEGGKFTDHSEESCLPLLGFVNYAVRALGMFRTKERLKEYCDDNNIDMKKGKFFVFNTIVRPWIDDLRSYQATKRNKPPQGDDNKNDDDGEGAGEEEEDDDDDEGAGEEEDDDDEGGDDNDDDIEF